MPTTNFSIPKELNAEWSRLSKRLDVGRKANWKVFSAMTLLAAETPSDILRFYAGAVASCRAEGIPMTLLVQMGRSGLLRELALKESSKLTPNFGAAFKAIVKQAKALPRGRYLVKAAKDRQQPPISKK